MNSQTFHLPAVIQTMRGPFLVLTPIVVILGASVSTLMPDTAWFDLTLIIVAALLAHISVNMLNEYSDFHSGLDMATQRTPFSGGSGALPQHPGSASAVLYGALLALALMATIGGYFIWKAGWLVLLYGVTGASIIVLYTRHINRSPLLCLIAPGIGFGLLMVSGTQLVLQHSISDAGIYASLIVFFLVNNLLLLNQFPDIEADRSAGRNHAAIAWGPSVAASLYGLFVAAAAITLLLAVADAVFPVWSALTLVALLPGVVAWRAALQLQGNIGQQPKYLAMNVIMNLLTPAVLAATLIGSR